MIILENGALWSAKKWLPQAAVVVEGGRIKSVHPGTPPERLREGGDSAGAPQRIDVAGKTILPGLINAHTHLCMDGSPDPDEQCRRDGTLMMAYKAAANAERTLQQGITTIRDLGAPGGLDVELKRAISLGVVRGPRLLVAGQVLCMTGGHGHYLGCEVDGPHEARKAARRQLKAGADVIKVMATGGVLTQGVEPGAAQLTPDELSAAIEEAHKAGKKVATHAQGTTGVLNAVRAGVDSVEHGFHLNEEIVDLMAERGVFYVPTLSAGWLIIEHGTEAGIPAYAVRKAEQSWEALIRSVDLARRGGVKIAAGTDAGTPFNAHGTVTLEIELMVKHGVSVDDALYAATLGAAECLGFRDLTGSLDEGKAADIIVVDGDPRKDTKALDRVILVMKEGQLQPLCRF